MTTLEHQQGAAQSVKTERLSPPPGSCFSGGGNGASGGGGGSGGSGGGGGDAASSSSRSGTPSSSYPGTPPGPQGRLSPPPPHPPPTKQIDAINRNYSDFMRSLAAKYNNNHPNDYFSGRNGFAASLAGLKAGTPPPPFLLPPPTVPSSQAGKEHQEEGRSPGEPLVAGLVGFPPPVGDMNATQVLLSMVRSHAGAAHQLENYLKGAVKAQHQEAVPLDLSTSARPGPQQPQQPPLKRYKRQSLGESLYGCELTGAGGLLLAAARQHTNQQPHKKSPGSPKTSRRRPAAPTCLSACSTASAQDRPSPVQPCTPESQTLLHWTVDDVVTFVASLDACAEYAPNFREQRIDGSALPLLTEEHLTSTLGMKLGPALKLRSILSSRLGQCSVCLHCAHCHQVQPTTQPLQTSGPASS